MATKVNPKVAALEARIGKLEAAIVSRERTRANAVRGLKADRAELKRRRSELAALSA